MSRRGQVHLSAVTDRDPAVHDPLVALSDRAASVPGEGVNVAQPARGLVDKVVVPDDSLSLIRLHLQVGFLATGVEVHHAGATKRLQ